MKNRRSIARLLAVASALTLGLGVAPPAQAATSPSFTSSVRIKVFLSGSTTFTIHTAAKARAIFQMDSADSYYTGLNVRIQRQVCGAFGCHWRGQDDAYVGGTCSVPHGRTTVCNFTPPISNRLHRLEISRRNDGGELTGKVYVS